MQEVNRSLHASTARVAAVFSFRTARSDYHIFRKAMHKTFVTLTFSRNVRFATRSHFALAMIENSRKRGGTPQHSIKIC
jgi:hypothetical protein